jgi:hypothetical protein
VSDIKLFTLGGNGAKELSGSVAQLERELQTHVENNMEVLLDVRFLKTEHDTVALEEGFRADMRNKGHWVRVT